MTVHVQCFCGNQAPARVTVAGGKVVSVTPVDGHLLPRGWPPNDLLTVDDIFRWIASNRGAHRLDASFDPVTGVPTTVSIDPQQYTADDERTVVISDLLPAA